MIKAKSEPELIRAARAGSPEACARLVRSNWRRAWAAALRITGSAALADEVSQDGFERAFLNLDDFDGRSPFGAWLERIVVNRAIDVVRSEERRRAKEEGLYDHRVFELAPPNHLVIAAVRRLEPEARILVALRFWLDYSYTQIAETLRVPEGTVASRLSRVLDRLREDLGSDHEDRP